MSHDNGPRGRLTDDQLNALKDRNPVHDVAGEWVKLRRKGRAGKFVGPCPICSDDPMSKSAMRFECDSDTWVCAVCHDGGDVIKLVSKREGIDFRAAVDRLGGGREEAPTPALAHKAGIKDFKAASIKTDAPLATPAIYTTHDGLRAAYAAGWRVGKRRADYEEYARDRERRRLFDFYEAGTSIAGTPVETYLSGRGLLVPPRARLRFHPAMPLFCDGREIEPVLAHTGPAMLAGIINAAGRFAGLHITWLDPAGPKGKALVHNPETGEVLPSKKCRGTKAGGYIDLGGCAVEDAERMIAGEGIETVLAVYTTLVRAGRDVSRTMFRAGIDLGNLAGRALASIAHPTLRTGNNRPQSVPGPDPDFSSPAMPVPDAVPELVLLGDGDSDPFLTRNAMERAKRRHTRPGRRVGVRFAPAGVDFDDLLNGATAND